MLAAVLLAALATEPVVPATDVRSIDAREKIWDGVEPFVDSQVCGRYKSGHREASTEAVAQGANLDLSRFVDVRSCSLRALQFLPSDAGSWDSVFLFEVDGIGFDGERRTLRGEADVQLDQRADGGWHIARNTPRWERDVERKEPLFEHLSADQTGFAKGAEGKGTEEDVRTMRGGLGLLDVNGDGLLDVFTTIRSSAQLYLNKGALQFEKTSFRFVPPAYAQLGPPAIGDFDNDGDPDVIVTLATNEMDAAYVFRNDKGTLTRAGFFPVDGWVAGVVPWDWNRDGKLDLTLIRYMKSRIPDDFLESTKGRTPLFFQGRGDLTFNQVKVSSKVVPNRAGLAGVAAPLDELSADSVYLANDYGSNDLLTWRDGGFVQRADDKGLRDPGNGMSADVGDVNADGQLDLYVANMFSKAGTRVLASAKLEGELGELLKKFAAGNTLYLSNGDGGYSEVAAQVGVNRGLWAFGSPFIDANDDGRLDMAVANGFLSRPDRKDL